MPVTGREGREKARDAIEDEGTEEKLQNGRKIQRITSLRNGVHSLTRRLSRSLTCAANMASSELPGPSDQKQLFQTANDTGELREGKVLFSISCSLLFELFEYGFV